MPVQYVLNDAGTCKGSSVDRCQNDVVLLQMRRRIDVNSASFLRYVPAGVVMKGQLSVFISLNFR